MDLAGYSSPIVALQLPLLELEDAFRVWAQGPEKPDVVDVGRNRHVQMSSLARHLAESQAPLAAPACAYLGLPPEMTIAAAAAALLRATVDPDGPRCRSFRAAAYYLRGCAFLTDFWANSPDVPSTSSNRSRATSGHRQNLTAATS